MKRLLSGLVMAVAAATLSGCYYDPGYSYVRSNGDGGDAYYGRRTTVYQDGYYAAPGYDDGGYYGNGYNTNYGYNTTYPQVVGNVGYNRPAVAPRFNPGFGVSKAANTGQLWMPRR